MAKKIEAPQESAQQVVSLGGAVTGGRDVSLPEVEVVPTLPIGDPNSQFILAVHPQSWSVRFDESGNPLLLPHLYPISMQHGVEGNNPEEKWRPSVMKAEREGWVIIDYRHKAPDGHTYVREMQVKTESSQIVKRYVTAFDTLYAGSRDQTTDRKALSQWIMGLVQQGAIPGPSIQALRSERAKIAKAHATAVSKSKVDYESEQAAIRLQAALKLIDGLINQSRSAMTPVAVSASSVELPDNS